MVPISLSYTTPPLGSTFNPLLSQARNPFNLNFFDSAQCLVVRRWRLIGHFPILYNPLLVQPPLSSSRAHRTCGLDAGFIIFDWCTAGGAHSLLIAPTCPPHVKPNHRPLSACVRIARLTSATPHRDSCNGCTTARTTCRTVTWTTRCVPGLTRRSGYGTGRGSTVCVRRAR
jgi:hypothetical protein